MNETDRNHFELRNELAQAVEIDGRTGLRNQLMLVQWMISKRARGECPHIHAEDTPEIERLLGKRWQRIGWPSKRHCDWAGDPR